LICLLCAAFGKYSLTHFPDCQCFAALGYVGTRKFAVGENSLYSMCSCPTSMIRIFCDIHLSSSPFCHRQESIFFPFFCKPTANFSFARIAKSQCTAPKKQPEKWKFAGGAKKKRSELHICFNQTGTDTASETLTIQVQLCSSFPISKSRSADVPLCPS
jgi:hypothetical protein